MDNLKQGIDKMVDEATREARRNTLNKRINYKGNYENYIDGGSHALNNQSHMDRNEYAKAMNDPNSGWANDTWIQGLNDRYTNPVHNREAGELPVESGRNYIHRYTASTKRGRRAENIFFEKARQGQGRSTPEELEAFQRLVNKYERWK